MKLTEMRWLVGAFYLALLLVSFVRKEPMTLGFSAESANGEYRVAGGTHPVALGFSVVAIAIYFMLMNSERSQGLKPLPGVFRRFIAFWFDFFLAIIAIAPVLGFLPTLIEWRRTGNFQWTFERNYAVNGDTAQITLLLLFTFTGLLLYYVVPLLRQRPSPGACLMGYQVIADDPASLTLTGMLKRTLLGFISLCTWYIAPFPGRDRKNGKFWLDKVVDTRAVLIE